jgi:hypothetical protein
LANSPVTTNLSPFKQVVGSTADFITTSLIGEDFFIGVFVMFCKELVASEIYDFISGFFAEA